MPTADSLSPKYQQVYTALRREIQSGRLKKGDRLPSEADLVRSFGASRITVVATSTPELKPPKRCTPLAISSAEQGVDATTAIPTCKER